MSFKQYSKLDQLRNEYQWWLEQRMTALNEGDVEYVKVCDEVMSKLWKDLKKEFYVEGLITKPEPKKKSFFKRLFGL